MYIKKDRKINPENIELIVTDVDGVWTDGSLHIDDHGYESKSFSVYDGFGVVLWRKSDKKFAMLSARSSRSVSIRAIQLGIDMIVQNSRDKAKDFVSIAHKLNTPLKNTLYIGDDLPDLRAFSHAAIRVAVSNACPELKEAADIVTNSPGGSGAIREVIEWLLKETGQWEIVTEQYYPRNSGIEA